MGVGDPLLVGGKLVCRSGVAGRSDAFAPMGLAVAGNRMGFSRCRLCLSPRDGAMGFAE
jgi:hypothetical protein